VTNRSRTFDSQLARLAGRMSLAPLMSISRPLSREKELKNSLSDYFRGELMGPRLEFRLQTVRAA
jgi:hypothetical protein